MVTLTIIELGATDLAAERLSSINLRSDRGRFCRKSTEPDFESSAPFFAKINFNNEKDLPKVLVASLVDLVYFQNLKLELKLCFLSINHDHKLGKSQLNSIN